MAPEIVHWFQDVREHLRVSQRRNALREPGQGVDYAAGSATVRSIVERLHPSRMRLRVIDIIEETPTTKTLRCERVDGPLPPWRPGQYVNVFVDVDGVLTSRPYSISSPPDGDVLDLTVRNKPKGFVAPYLLNELRVGDDLETTGPAGSFYYEPLTDGHDLVFLAGGSGITPFMSIIRDALGDLEGKPSRQRMHLLYGSRKAGDIIFGRELAELAAAHSNFRFTPVISEPPLGYRGLTGFLCADLIRRVVGNLEGKTFYICGPNVMYGYCLVELAELGVPYYKIKRELYGPPDDVTREPGWPEDLPASTIFQVEVQGRASIHAPAGEPLLNSMERYGLVVPAVCRAGECSACRIRLLSGKVFQPAQTCLRESDREQGYIHACVSYPLEDLRVRI